MLGISLSIVIMGCTKDDSDTDSPTPENVEQTITTTTWKITKFVEDGIDETADYQGYILQFNANGAASISKNGAVITTGNWSARIDDGKSELFFNFSGSEDIQELNDDWTIIELGARVIKMEDDNDNFTDLLALEAV